MAFGDGSYPTVKCSERIRDAFRGADIPAIIAALDAANTGARVEVVEGATGKRLLVARFGDGQSSTIGARDP